MKIRKATPADLPRIAAVHTTSWKDSYAGVLPQAYMDHQLCSDLERHWQTVTIQPEDVVLVGGTDDVIGFIAVWCRPVAFIDNLHMLPGERSRGGGTMLMQAAVRQLLRQGHRSAYLWAVATNERAIRYYEKLGAVRTDQASKDLFGHTVPSLKMEWTDIADILADQ